MSGTGWKDPGADARGRLLTVHSPKETALKALAPLMGEDLSCLRAIGLLALGPRTGGTRFVARPPARPGLSTEVTAQPARRSR
ncbi:hypothetical protein ACU4GG_40215 [Streptomyces nojiriensis]